MRKKAFTLALAFIMALGLVNPAFTANAEDITAEEILSFISLTYDVDGTKVDGFDGIEIDKDLTYDKFTESENSLQVISTHATSYLAIREDSTFTLSHTGTVDDGSYMVVYVAVYVNTGNNVYEPEWTCRQRLTPTGFWDENLPLDLYGGISAVGPGGLLQFKLPSSSLAAIVHNTTDVLYGLEIHFHHRDSDSRWIIDLLYKVDDVAVDAYLAGQGSKPSTPAPDLSYISSPSDADPTTATVLVNGEEKSFDAYSINNNNYFKLRDLAYVLSGTDKQFEVSWDNTAKAISLTSGNSYTAVGGEMSAKGSGTQTANPSSAKIILDGKEIALTAYEIGGNNYFKLRDIGQTFNFGVGWDNTSRTITIDTSIGYTA